MKNSKIKITKGEATRRRILVEALQLYSEKGVQNTPFQEIADKIGITQAALYKYFNNRDELLKEAVLLAGEEGREFFKLDPKQEAKMSEREKFFHHLKMNIEWAQSGKPHNVGFLSLHYFASQIKQIGEVHAEVMNLRVNRFKMYLQNMQKEENLKLENINSIAVSVHNMVLGEMLEAYNHSGSETTKKRTERVFNNILKILGVAV